MDKLEGHLVDIKESLTNKVAGQDKQTVSIIVTIFGVILAGLIGFISNALFK
jgi:hypothetical protein